MINRDFILPGTLVAGAVLLSGLTIVQSQKMDSVQIVNYVKSGTVLVENERKDKQGGIGTGFLLGPNMFVTNNHVIDENEKLTIITPDSHKYEAEVVYTDPVADVAIVKVNDWAKFNDDEDPHILKLADSDDMPVGSKVVVIGHPWGLTWTVSEGIVSAKNRRPSANPKYVDQIDANLFQGNSGGPVFNEYGEVSCISNLMLTGEGGSYGFCIPSNLVKKVIHDFETMGEIRWRVLNVSVSLTDDGRSVIVESLESGGAAEKAGLQVKDKILGIYTPNNHPRGIIPHSPNDLITELATMNGDDELVKLKVQRGDEMMMIDVQTNYKLSKEYPTPKK